MPTTPQLPPTNLKVARLASGLSQVLLGRITRTHPSVISAAERSGFVSARLAARLAPALGVAPESLREEEP